MSTKTIDEPRRERWDGHWRRFHWMLYRGISMRTAEARVTFPGRRMIRLRLQLDWWKPEAES